MFSSEVVRVVLNLTFRSELAPSHLSNRQVLNFGLCLP